MDTFNRWVMPLTLELTPVLQPSRSDEVGTVIWISSSSRGMGTYSGGARAAQGSVDLTIVDLVDSAIGGTGTLYGPEPPAFVVAHDPEETMGARWRRAERALSPGGHRRRMCAPAISTASRASRRCWSTCRSKALHRHRENAAVPRGGDYLVNRATARC